MLENNNNGSLTASNVKEIDLHIAEYAALTTRCTYFANINIILLTALIAWIVVIVTIWDDKFEYMLIWIALLGAQIIAYINSIFFTGNYSIVYYIESTLRPKISELIGTDTFWGYESFLFNRRKKIKGTSIYEFFGVLIALVAVFACIVYRFKSWQNWDWLGLCVNSVFFILTLIKTFQGTKMRVSGWKK